MVDKNIPILVVEDNSTMRRIVVGLVKQLGFTNVSEAIDGTNALEVMNEKPIGFIISDWHMEPMTGLELLRKVRADEKFKKTPFLMVTAESKAENIIVAKKSGVNNYIIKPFNLNQIKDKIASILGPF